MLVLTSLSSVETISRSNDFG